MSRRVYRSTVQAALLTIGMLAFLLIAIASFIDGDMVAKRDWFGLILYPIIGVASIIGIWLAVRLGVVVDHEGLQLRGFGRGRRIPWAAVDSIQCRAYTDRLFAPVIALTIDYSTQRKFLGLPMSTTKTAERVTLTALGSYRRATAQRRTDQLIGEIPTGRGMLEVTE